MKHVIFKALTLTFVAAGFAMLPTLQAATEVSSKGARLDTQATPVSVTTKSGSHSLACPMQKSQAVTYTISADAKNHKEVTVDGQTLKGDCSNITSRSLGAKKSETKMVCKDEAKAAASGCPKHQAAK